jgi:hypothetical protein
VIRVAPDPQRLIVGTFLVLAAMVCAVAPMPVLFRSAGIVLFSYLAFGVAGMPFAYLTALLAPPIGLITGDTSWLVMLPIVMSSNLLGMLALEYAWRYPALIVSPLLLIVPPLFVQIATRRELFAVALPWDGAQTTWITLHLLVAAAGILTAFVLDRRRERADDRRGSRGGGRLTSGRPAAPTGRVGGPSGQVAGPASGAAPTPAAPRAAPQGPPGSRGRRT